MPLHRLVSHWRFKQESDKSQKISTIQWADLRAFCVSISSSRLRRDPLRVVRGMTNRAGNKSDRPRGRSDALKRARGGEESLPSSFVAVRQQLERNYEPGRAGDSYPVVVSWVCSFFHPFLSLSSSSSSSYTRRKEVCLVVGVYPPGACGF